MARKEIAIIGGGATGAALLWCLTRHQDQRSQYRATLFHNEKDLGGHSDTYFVEFDANGKGSIVPDMTPGSFAIDIGVQFVCKPVYPNMYAMLELPEFDGVQAMALKNHPLLRVASAFRDHLNWGNFPEYQSGPRFDECYSPAAVKLAERFQEDIRLFDFNPPTFWWISWTIERYLEHAGIPKDSDFFRYMLVSYLTIINGYGTDELLKMTKRDLFPIFAHIPLLTDPRPLAAFTHPGVGWDRFEYGAQRWVEGMADFAIARGADVRKKKHVTRVAPKAQGDKVRVEWVEADDKNNPHAQVHSALFDVVVMTADMDANRVMLDHPQNPYWAVQKELIGPGSWNLMPGLCIIHQDEEVLSPSLRDQLEDAQFNAYYTWDGNTAGNQFNLPYKLEDTYTTYLMKNIVGCPAPCYVSMYAVADHAKRPDPSKIIFQKEWKHGRWVSSHDMLAKQGLHEIQGLGNVWFAGNNTTVDSEEGALISALAIAEKIAGARYPFEGNLLAEQTYSFFQKIMFPPPHLSEILGLSR